MKLYEMKDIAQYVLGSMLTDVELAQLNVRLIELKSEVLSLERQLQAVVH